MPYVKAAHTNYKTPTDTGVRNTYGKLSGINGRASILVLPIPISDENVCVQTFLSA